MKHITISALQLSTLGMHDSKLEFYFKNAKKRLASIVVIGEYVLNHFLKELEHMPPLMVEEQTNKHLEILQKMSKIYDMVVIAPFVIYKNGKFYKTIAKITPQKTTYQDQQILLPYEHWNEQEFFGNKITKLKKPMFFTHNGFKVMVISGYELHFSYFWEIARDKQVDLVILPTASTFESHNRWREIIKTQAFLNGCYILRVNRIGEYSDKDAKWRFYGDTMLVTPDGEVEMMLEDKESMLVEDIFKEEVQTHRKIWQFEKAINIRK